MSNQHVPIGRRTVLAGIGGVAFSSAARSLLAQGDEEPTAARAVQFLAGELMPAEGGTWDRDSGPLTSPFGVDFDADGNLYLVELGGGRVHRYDRSGRWRRIA